MMKLYRAAGWLLAAALCVQPALAQVDPNVTGLPGITQRTTNEYVAVIQDGVRKVGTPSQVTSNVYAWNFKQSNTGKIRRALMRLTWPVSAFRPSNNNPVLLHVGDSTTAGAAAGVFNTATYAISYVNNSYPSRFGEQLARRYGISVVDGYWGDRKQNGYDPRVTLGAGVVNNSGQISLSGYAINWGSSITTTTAFDFTAATNANQPSFDCADIWHVQFNGGGTYTVNADGGATLTGGTISTSNATGALAKATVTGASLGTHVLNIARTTGGAVYIAGVVPRNCSLRQLINVNAGRGGWKASDYASTSNPWSPANAIAALAPEGTFINLGINETAPVDWAAYKASIQVIIDKAKLSGDVVLIVPHWVDTATVPLATQQALSTAIYELATTNDLPVFDKQKLYVSRTQQSADGYVYDTLHNDYPDASLMGWALEDALASPW